MDSRNQVENIIAHGLKNGDSPARIARHLDDSCRFMPNIPEPAIFFDHGELEWVMVDGYVNLNGWNIVVNYDERDEDTYLTDPTAEPGEIYISDTTQGRELAYRILAACDYKDDYDS